MAPPIAFATLSVNVLFVTLSTPLFQIAPPPLKPPAEAVEKLLLKTLSMTVSFAITNIAPPDHAAVLLLNWQPLIVSDLPENEIAPPSLTVLKPLLIVMPEIDAVSTTLPKVKMR